MARLRIYPACQPVASLVGRMQSRAVEFAIPFRSREVEVEELLGSFVRFRDDGPSVF